MDYEKNRKYNNIFDKYNASKLAREIYDSQHNGGPTNTELLYQSRADAMSKIWSKKRDELDVKFNVKCELEKTFSKMCSKIDCLNEVCKTQCTYYAQVIAPCYEEMKELKEARKHFEEQARYLPMWD